MKSYQKIAGIGYLLQGLFILGAGFLEAYFFSRLPNLPVAPPSSGSDASGTSNPIVSIAVLGVIFVVAVVPTVLSCLGWLLSGRNRKRDLFIGTGVVGLSALGLFLVSFLYLGLDVFSSSLAATPSSSAFPVTSFLAFGALYGVGALLAMAFVILTIVSLFSAAKEFGVPYFRYAGISFVVAIVTSIIGAVVIFAAVFSSIAAVGQPATNQALNASLSGIIRAFIAAIPLLTAPAGAASILAGLAFFKPPAVPVAFLTPIVPATDQTTIPAPAPSQDGTTKVAPEQVKARRNREAYVALALVALIVLSSIAASAAAYDSYSGVPGLTLSSTSTSSTTLTQYTSTDAVTSISSSGCPSPSGGPPAGPGTFPLLSVGNPGVTDTAYSPYQMNFLEFTNGTIDTFLQMQLPSTSVVTGQFTSDNALEVFILLHASFRRHHSAGMEYPHGLRLLQRAGQRRQHERHPSSRELLSSADQSFEYGFNNYSDSEY